MFECLCKIEFFIFCARIYLHLVNIVVHCSSECEYIIFDNFYAALTFMLRPFWREHLPQLRPFCSATDELCSSHGKCSFRAYMLFLHNIKKWQHLWPPKTGYFSLTFDFIKLTSTRDILLDLYLSLSRNITKKLH